MSKNSSDEGDAVNDGYKVAAAWANPAARPTLHSGDETLLALSGIPLDAPDGSFWLGATIGPAPLTEGQALVAGALILDGAWASVLSIPPEYRAEVPGMVDAGLLYAFNVTDSGFYRGNLVPQLLFDRDTPLEFGQVPESLFEMFDLGVPRGGGAARFPSIVVRVLGEIDGERSAEEVSSAAIDTILEELGIGPTELPKAEMKDLEKLQQFARLSLVLAVQAGLVAMDLRWII